MGIAYNILNILTLSKQKQKDMNKILDILATEEAGFILAGIAVIIAIIGMLNLIF